DRARRSAYRSDRSLAQALIAVNVSPGAGLRSCWKQRRRHEGPGRPLRPATRHGLPAYYGKQPAPGGAVRQPHTSPAGGAAAPAGWPAAGFHSRTVPSPSSLASSLPSGLNATLGTPLRAPVRMGVPTRWPVAGFHSRTVPLESLLAGSLPL